MKLRMTLFAAAALAALLSPRPALSLVKMDQGRVLVDGIQLLQDYADSTAYYYVPTYPRLAEDSDGNPSLLCLKYVDPKGKTGGGLFHALIEFTLPPAFVTQLDADLKKQIGAGHIVGPVPLMQADPADGQDAHGSFEVVSAVLGDTGEGGFTRKLITSGKAPITPGSRAAIAAILNAQGATLLWDSLSGPTSDVSVAVNCYYEAMVTGFDARITADTSTIYTHFSAISNTQHDFTKNQVRDVVDDLRRTGAIKVEVLDRSKGLDLKATEMQGLVDNITNKITELMFDSKTGWSTDPPREVAVEEGQLAGRQEKGFFGKLFGGTGDQPYYTDNQYVLKNRKDIRTNTFSIILTKNATIKVPVNTAGNLHGLYDKMKDDPHYFRIVNLNDPAFEFRSIFFQVDGEYASSFQDTINFVAVNFRKKLANGTDFTGTVRFSPDTLKDGKLVQEIAYPRLGETGSDWLNYEYQVVWSVHNRNTVSVPSEEGQWIAASDPAISLAPPLDKISLDIDSDRGKFGDAGVASANIVFEYRLLKLPKRTRVTLRAQDTSSTSQTVLYKDATSKVNAKVTWYFKNGKQVVKDLGVTDETYFNLVPPPAPVDDPK